jgi:hypothetical protein
VDVAVGVAEEITVPVPVGVEVSVAGGGVTVWLRVPVGVGVRVRPGTVADGETVGVRLGVNDGVEVVVAVATGKIPLSA